MGRNLCFLVSLILAFDYSFGQELPSVACPDKFAYVKLDDRFVGQVSVVLNGSSTHNQVKVDLMKRGVSSLKLVGDLKLSEPKVVEKLKKNEKINLQLDISKTDVLPKLQRIIVNGEIVCEDAPYDLPFAVYTRTLGFYTLPDQDKAKTS